MNRFEDLAARNATWVVGMLLFLVGGSLPQCQGHILVSLFVSATFFGLLSIAHRIDGERIAAKGELTPSVPTHPRSGRHGVPCPSGKGEGSAEIFELVEDPEWLAAWDSLSAEDGVYDIRSHFARDISNAYDGPEAIGRDAETTLPKTALWDRAIHSDRPV